MDQTVAPTNALSAFAHLCAREIVKSLTLLVRYPLGSLATVAVMALIFVGIYQTSLSIIPNGTPTDLDRIATVQRYVLWTAMILGFSSVSGSVADETRTGLIEIVWMSRFPPALTLLVRATVTVIISTIISIGIAAAIAAVYGIPGVFSPRFFLAEAAAAIAAIGVGLGFGGLTVVFKDIGSAINLVQFLLLPLFLSLSAATFGPLLLLPGFNAVELLGCATCTTGISDWLLFLPSIAWLVIGYAALTYAVRLSRRRGLVYEY